jgi:hypothetical protein
MNATQVSTRLSGREVSGGFKAKCPAHDDGHASLSIGSGDDGRVLLKCFAGCSTDDICRAMNVKAADLFPEKERGPRQRVTLASLAEHKKLPVGFLRELGLREPPDGGVAIPYRGVDGSEVAVKRRVDLVAKLGSLWPKGTTLLPYGLERLADARELDQLVLVEGESDCWTLWHHGYGALGIPGASSTKTIEKAHLSGLTRVYAIRETDKGGDEFIAALPKRLEAIGWTGQLLVVDCGANDPSDLHGRDPVQFRARFDEALRTAKPVGAVDARPAAPSKPAGEGFLAAEARLATERKNREAQKGAWLSFGVPFLDLALGGIVPNDLILIGAKTGVGKTALASWIAQYNAFMGKRVHYFALEAEPMEIERRIKYGLLAKLVRKRISGDHEDMNFLDWYMFRLEHKCAQYEAEVNETIAKNFSTLFTYYRQADFYAEHFEQLVDSVAKDTDLIILDHLHYVDSDEPSENKAYKIVVKKIRDVSLRIGKPIIVVAHLRKSERRGGTLVPGIEDFHGTSDVPKMATKAIMLAPAHEQESGDRCLWPTYIYPAKCRFEGSRTRYVALCNFDVRTGGYESAFTLGRPSVDGLTWNAAERSDWPDWATRAAK